MRRVLLILALLWAAPSFAAFTTCATGTFTSSTGLLPSTQSNFTVTVDITDNHLKAMGSGGDVTDAQGDDIVFKPSAACTGTTMKYEIEFWDGTSGHLVAHVLVASVALSGNIYLGIGDAAITTFQGGAVADVYDTATLSVLNFPNGSSLSIADSGRQGYVWDQGSNAATAAAGKVDGGAAFAAASQQYIHTHDAPVNLEPGATPGPYTVCLWAKPASLPSSQMRMWSQLGTDANSYVVLYISAMNQFEAFYRDSDGASLTTTDATTTLMTGTWYRSCTVRNATNVRIYTNGGADKDSDTGTLATIHTADAQAAVGAAYPGDAVNFDGVLDQIVVSSVARSQDWLTADANQYGGSGFITFDFAGGATPGGGMLLTGVGK